MGALEKGQEQGQLFTLRSATFFDQWKRMITAFIVEMLAPAPAYCPCPFFNSGSMCSAK